MGGEDKKEKKFISIKGINLTQAKSICVWTSIRSLGDGAVF